MVTSTEHAIFWDLGGVLLDVDLDAVRARWAAYTRLSTRTFDRYFFESGLRDALSLGQLTPVQVLTHLNDGAARDLTLDQLTDIWNAALRVRPAQSDLVIELAKRFRSGVISDTDPLHAAFTAAQAPFAPTVRSWTFSFEQGVFKPDPAMYRAALSALDVEPARALFVDDRQGNVQGAWEAGMDAIVYTDFPSLVAALESRGLTPR